jgi:DNA-binding GntR family transcriptional regulator
MVEETSKQPRLSALDVVRRIEEKIAQGQLVPGQRLVEPDLMAELGVSRPTVREALSFLAGDGVVELVPFRGGRIKQLDPKRLGEMLAVFWAILRAAIEEFGRRPITKAAKLDLENARDRIAHASAYGSTRHLLQASFAYNDVIYKHSGNSYLAEALDRLHVRHFLRQATFEDFLRTDVDSAGLYRAVTDALLAGDADGAIRLLRPEMSRLAAHVSASSS